MKNRGWQYSVAVRGAIFGKKYKFVRKTNLVTNNCYYLARVRAPFVELAKSFWSIYTTVIIACRHGSES